MTYLISTTILFITLVALVLLVVLSIYTALEEYRERQHLDIQEDYYHDIQEAYLEGFMDGHVQTEAGTFERAQLRALAQNYLQKTINQ